tara:strand:+ start:273 stop:398 length:126 start_codon:yes stop_codon:yes gene_type:complete
MVFTVFFVYIFGMMVAVVIKEYCIGSHKKRRGLRGKKYYLF